LGVLELEGLEVTFPGFLLPRPVNIPHSLFYFKDDKGNWYVVTEISPVVEGKADESLLESAEPLQSFIIIPRWPENLEMANSPKHLNINHHKGSVPGLLATINEPANDRVAETRRKYSAKRNGKAVQYINLQQHLSIHKLKSGESVKEVAFNLAGRVQTARESTSGKGDTLTQEEIDVAENELRDKCVTEALDEWKNESLRAGVGDGLYIEWKKDYARMILDEWLRTDGADFGYQAYRMDNDQLWVVD